MAEQLQRGAKVTPLRVLVVIALILHAVGLFALPYLGFLFSPDVRELMKYGGHGATINPTHPIVYAFYLIPYPALVGIFLGLNWGRYLLLGYFVVLSIASFFLGASVSGPPESFLSIVGALVDGAILGVAFFAGQGVRAQPSNSTPHADARDVPASAGDSAARAGGRER